MTESFNLNMDDLNPKKIIIKNLALYDPFASSGTPPNLTYGISLPNISISDIFIPGNGYVYYTTFGSSYIFTNKKPINQQ